MYHSIGLGHRFAKHPPGWRRDKVWPSEVIVKAKTSETWAFAFIASATILDQALTVFSSDDRGLFAILQSTLNEVWARDSGAGSKMKTDLRYAPTVFEAFPLPDVRNNLGLVRQLLTFVFSEQRDGSCSSSRRESAAARGVPSPAAHR